MEVMINESESKALSLISVEDLKKEIQFKNWNKQWVTIAGQKGSYLAHVRMGLGFDDITQAFTSLKEVKEYIKRNIAK